MSTCAQVALFSRTIVAFFSVIGIVAGAPAAAPQPATATIRVFTDRYVLENRAFEDLDLLEKHITAMRPREIRLLVCAPAAARPLKAAVHRFRQLPVQIRVPDADEQVCFSRSALATPVRGRVGQRPFGIDDAAVERYWRGLMP